MGSITAFFQEQAIRDGVATILEHNFGLDLTTEQMSKTTEIIFNTLDEMPVYTADEDGELDMETELFFYLIHTMLKNIMLHAKINAMQAILEDRDG